MKRLLLTAVATIAVSTTFIPSSAEAGILGRLFGRNRESRPTVRYVEREPDGYRRYSYEPLTNQSYPSGTYNRGGTRNEPWRYLKTDPRRYQY